MSVYSNTAKKSDLLIAEPFLIEPTFKRSVILLTEKNEENTVGFILNKPVAGIIFSDLFKDFPEFDAPLFMGGPVNQENVYYIHSYPNLFQDCLHIKDDLYMGGDFEILKKKIIEQVITPEKIRFYLGYSGWSPNQLEEELLRKSWIVSDFDKEIIHSTKDYNKLWQDVLSSRGGEYKEIANFPTNPSLN